MSQRLDYLDVAKGIGILLVILGHCQLGRNLHAVIFFSYAFVLFCFRNMLLQQIYFFLIGC